MQIEDKLVEQLDSTTITGTHIVGSVSTLEAIHHFVQTDLQVVLSLICSLIFIYNHIRVMRKKGIHQ